MAPPKLSAAEKAARAAQRAADAEKAKRAAEAAQQANALEDTNTSGIGNGIAEPKRAGAHVTVACKIGVAWFDLQLCVAKNVKENTQTGVREITQWFRTGKLVRVRGTSYPRGTPPEGFPAAPEMVGGYALTHNVDKDFFEQWEKQHAKSPYVMSQMIFAGPPEAVVKMCKERSALKSGLEPMMKSIRQGEKLIIDPRVPKSAHAQVEDLQTADVK